MVEVGRKEIEALTRAIIVQAATDYLYAKKQIYQQGDFFEARYKLEDTGRFFKSAWFELMSPVDGAWLVRALDKEFEEWRIVYEAKRKKKGGKRGVRA